MHDTRAVALTHQWAIVAAVWEEDGEGGEQKGCLVVYLWAGEGRPGRHHTLQIVPI